MANRIVQLVYVSVDKLKDAQSQYFVRCILLIPPFNIVKQYYFFYTLPQSCSIFPSLLPLSDKCFCFRLVYKHNSTSLVILFFFFCVFLFFSFILFDDFSALLSTIDYLFIFQITPPIRLCVQSVRRANGKNFAMDRSTKVDTKLIRCDKREGIVKPLQYERHSDTGAADPKNLQCGLHDAYLIYTPFAGLVVERH